MKNQIVNSQPWIQKPSKPAMSSVTITCKAFHTSLFTVTCRACHEFGHGNLQGLHEFSHG